MNQLTNEQYQQLENHWHTTYSDVVGVPAQRDPWQQKEADRIHAVLVNQFDAMTEEEQGAFGMALRVSQDEGEADGLPLTIGQLYMVRKRVLNETYRLLAADKLISERG